MDAKSNKSQSQEHGKELEPEARLVAHIFGELAPEDAAALEGDFSQSPELAQERASLEATVALVKDSLPADSLSPELRATLLLAAKAEQRAHNNRTGFSLLPGGVMRAVVGLAAAAMALLLWRPWLDSAEPEFAGDLASLELDEADSEAPPSFVGGSLSRDELMAHEAGQRFAKQGLVDELEEMEVAREEPLLLDFGIQVANGAVVFETIANRLRIRAGSGGGDGGAHLNEERARFYSEMKGSVNLPQSARVLVVQENDPSKDEFGREPQADDYGEVLPFDPDAWVGQPMRMVPTVVGRDRIQAQAGGEGDVGRHMREWLQTDSATSLGVPVASQPLVFPRLAPDSSLGTEIYASNTVTRRLESLGYADDKGAEVGLVLDSVSADLDDSSRKNLKKDTQAGQRTPVHGLEFSQLRADVSAPDQDDDGEVVERQAEIQAQLVEVAKQRIDLLQRRVLDGLAPLEGEASGQLFFRYWGDNPWVRVEDSALSTFAADVDTGSFGVMRRVLRAGRLPRPDQVRTEELVNWWRPDVPAPTGGSTFRIVMEAAPSRFNADPEVALLRVALRGREVTRTDRKPLALTIVIDVSGSMDDHGRIGLVREALKLLMRELSTTDSIAIVTFGTEAETLVPMLSAANRGPFEDALDVINPDGGTNVESGLVAGFQLAAAELTPGAVNRVVFLSDGVGNIGETDQARILELVSEERAKGIYLSTIGVGYGVDASEEYADDFLEQLADKGDGLYHNINDTADAERYLVDQFTATLEPIARDVKIQLEFDPDQVAGWRQIGYENRALTTQQFRDDSVDAGEVHAGHQVNALYEVQLRPGLTADAPLATVRVRWKEPFAIDAGDDSEEGSEAAEVASEIEQAFKPAALARSFADTSLGYRRAALVGQLAELLRRSEHASGDAPSELLDEMETLAPFLADVDFDELLGLLRDLRPALQALAEELGPIDLAIDTIRRSQVDLLERQEQLAREREETRRKELQTQIERVRTDIDRMEKELADLLQSELSPPAVKAR